MRRLMLLAKVLSTLVVCSRGPRHQDVVEKKRDLVARCQ